MDDKIKQKDIEQLFDSVKIILENNKLTKFILEKEKTVISGSYYNDKTKITYRIQLELDE